MVKRTLLKERMKKRGHLQVKRKEHLHIQDQEQDLVFNHLNDNN